MSQILFDQRRDFTGGVNFRADQFQLKPNETPSILNLEVDPRGGVFTRAGYKKFHTTEIVTTTASKGLFNYKHPTTPVVMYTSAFSGATNGTVQRSTGSNFSTLDSAVSTPLAVKSTNGASFTQWEDILYIALGASATQMFEWTAGNTYATALTASGPTWQPYDIPVGGYMPRAELVRAHANKLFVANTFEDGVAYPNRLRWSHENLPEDWYQQDFIDIIAGGEGIRGMEVIDGQLLIFKPKAVYLLMGYDVDSFQLVEVSTTVGIDFPQQAVEGNGGVYFFDYPLGLFFYSRNGLQNIFDRLNPIITENRINAAYLVDVTLSYINDRLWMSMPFDITGSGTLPTYSNVNFVFDPSIGAQGAYTMFQSSTYANTAPPVVLTGYGLVSGCDWEDSSGNVYHLMISPNSSFDFVLYVDDYEYVTDDTTSGNSTGDIATEYTTSWFYDDRYVQDKTFVNTVYVVKGVEEETQIRVNAYHDFNSQAVAATHTLTLTPTSTGGLYGTGLFGTAVFGLDTLQEGIQVGGRLKTAKAVQLEFLGPTALLTGTAGRAWGINSIAFKYKRRKVRSNN